MHSIKLFFSKLTTGKTILILLSPAIALLLSMKAALIGLLILIIADLITGIIKTTRAWDVPLNMRKAIFWKGIKSYLLRNTWRKSYEYGMGIIVVAIFESLIFTNITIQMYGKIFKLTELAVVVAAVIEIWSIFENLETSTGSNILKRSVHLLPKGIRQVITGQKEETPNEYEGGDEYED